MQKKQRYITSFIIWILLVAISFDVFCLYSKGLSADSIAIGIVLLPVLIFVIGVFHIVLALSIGFIYSCVEEIFY